ncbi:MAG: hypothetical protein AAFY71_16365 [Bacteroidota bacterium]
MMNLSSFGQTELPLISEPAALDSASWNWKMFESDKKNMVTERDPYWDFFPMNVLAFPVVDYKYGSAGTGSYFFEKDHKVSLSYFLIGKHDFNKEEFEEGETHYAFFNLVLLTDTLEPENYELVYNYVTSRNYPDYVGIGRTKTLHRNVDYVCFFRPDGSSYAIVGSKLFDLRKGETVVAALQKDGTFRFMQLDTPKLFMKEIQPYFKQMLEEQPIKPFFELPGNIK